MHHPRFRTQQQQAAGGDVSSGFYGGDLDDISFGNSGGNHSGSQSITSMSCSTGGNEFGCFSNANR